MNYETAAGRPIDGQVEAKVPATIDLKAMLEKMAAAFKKMKKIDGDRNV